MAKVQIILEVESMHVPRLLKQIGKRMDMYGNKGPATAQEAKEFIMAWLRTLVREGELEDARAQLTSTPIDIT